jgi:hypothetical protein
MASVEEFLLRGVPHRPGRVIARARVVRQAGTGRETMITRRRLLSSASIAVLGTAFGWPATAFAAAEKTAIPVALFKNPGCSCCEDYAAYLGRHGFTVTVKESDKLAALSARAGIPPDLEGCHTAFIEGYVVDGHVPIEAVQKMLAERPSLKGLAVPGMPPGSPGMPGDKEGPLIVYAIDQEGHSQVYMTL